MSEPNHTFTADAGASRREEEIEAADGDFANVRIAEFYSPRKVAFDLFLRLGANRYLRIYRAGENFEEAELKAYEAERGVRLVYFGRSYRPAYIASSATLLQKIIPLAAVPLRTKFGVARILSELYMQEIFECDDAARPALVNKGRDLCSILAGWVDSQPGLARHLLQLEQIDASPAALSFLIAVFSCVLSHQMPWKSKRTTENLLLAVFLSDIGLSALPPEIQRLKAKRMNAQQKKQFEKHPEVSFLLLTDTGSEALTENVMLIVRQHHEYCDGSGFPRGLTGDKTLMLSKLVVLCGDLMRTASDYLLPPGEAAKVMFPEFTEKLLKEHPELVAKYERELLVPFFKLVTSGGGA